MTCAFLFSYFHCPWNALLHITFLFFFAHCVYCVFYINCACAARFALSNIGRACGIIHSPPTVFLASLWKDEILKNKTWTNQDLTWQRCDFHWRVAQNSNLEYFNFVTYLSFLGVTISFKQNMKKQQKNCHIKYVKILQVHLGITCTYITY